MLGLLPVTLFAGCATFSPDGGFDAVSYEVEQRLGEKPAWHRSAEQPTDVADSINNLLAEPLTPESAVRIALLNNPGLQAALSELRIAEADVVQAGRLRNPGFSYARLKRGDEIEIERGAVHAADPLADRVASVRAGEARRRRRNPGAGG